MAYNRTSMAEDPKSAEKGGVYISNYMSAEFDDKIDQDSSQDNLFV